MERSIFPEFTPFPKLEKVIQGVKKIATLGARTELCLTSYPKKGAAELLDCHLYQEAERL